MANEDTNIQIVGSEQSRRGLDQDRRDRIAQLVRERLLAGSDVEYHAANVEILRDDSGAPKQLEVCLLRRHSYGADVVHVDIDEDFAALAIHR